MKFGFLSQIKNVRTHEKEDRMESFFLAETAKYLYLLFDEHNFIHQSNGSLGLQIERTRSPSCTPESSGYIFNTEAHPIDIGALHCCFPSALTHLSDRQKQGHANSETDGKKAETFTGAHTCKARNFHKRMSLSGAFFEGLEIMNEELNP